MWGLDRGPRVRRSACRPVSRHFGCRLGRPGAPVDWMHRGSQIPLPAASLLPPRRSSTGGARITAGSPWLAMGTILSPAARQGGKPCTATATPKRPFEPTSKRRRGFPLASPTLSAATASSALTPSSWKSSVATIPARADPAAVFRHCCRRTGRFDGTPASYYVRDREP
jgi:hypothetical protein